MACRTKYKKKTSGARIFCWPLKKIITDTHNSSGHGVIEFHILNPLNLLEGGLSRGVIYCLLRSSGARGNFWLILTPLRFERKKNKPSPSNYWANFGSNLAPLCFAMGQETKSLHQKELKNCLGSLIFGPRLRVPPLMYVLSSVRGFVFPLLKK